MECEKQILDFYKQTSLYTYLGEYTEFAKSLPDNINELCILQRKQIIHPVVFKEPNIREKENCFWGNMTEIPTTRLNYEDDLFPTAISMISELLRKDNCYSLTREAVNKIHITCRGQAILLASILKAKGFSARVRSGFAPYIKYDGINYDHWITEYYDEKNMCWKLVDKFIFGAEAYLGLRNNKYCSSEIVYSSCPPTLGIKGAIRSLFYDFHSLMNNEIIFLHIPKYIVNKNFNLSDEEYLELDVLAKLMLNPNKNFNKLLHIWNTKTKFRILCGALND